MKHSLTLLLTASVLAGVVAVDASAQFRGLGNALKRGAEREAERAADRAGVEAVQSVEDAIRNSQTRGAYAKSSGPVEMGVPAKELTDFTQCSGIKLENVTIGKLGEYTFQQGFSKEKRTGFINRRKGEVIRDCITPSLQSGEIVYFEVDTAKYEAMNKGNDWRMQCVNSSNPSGGTVQLNDWRGESEMYLSDKDMKLHCGNDQGVEDCATGTNSKRSQAYKSDLKARGKTGLSFMARYVDNGRDKDAGKLYCQFYNKRTGKSLVGFEMMYLKRPR